MSQEKADLVSTWTNLDGCLMHSLLALPGVGNASPPVVLVHGMVVASGYMAPLGERLGLVRHVYIPDLPGYGQSESREILGLNELSDALADWMRTLALRPAVLIGNSFGCQVIARTAVRHPEMVDRLVLIGPTVDEAGRSLWRLLARWSLEAPQEFGMGHILAVDYLRAGPRRTLATLRMVLDSTIDEDAAQIDAPALVVRGTWDPVAPQEWVERLADTFPRGQVCAIPGAAHAANFSSPNRLAKAVLPFLNEAAAQTASPVGVEVVR